MTVPAGGHFRQAGDTWVSDERAGTVQPDATQRDEIKPSTRSTRTTTDD
ncbi:hypothetical protein [Sinomonas notoginsengisoli]|nr:hypothetical protein [Sinomonas notoginsengisoli]